MRYTHFKHMENCIRNLQTNIKVFRLSFKYIAIVYFIAIKVQDKKDTADAINYG